MNIPIRSVPCLLLALSTVLVQAQIPTKCLEIESILVDACISTDVCPTSGEGMNEMVRFKVGPDPIPLTALEVDWPNNGFFGFIQDATTASHTAELNTSVEGCGWLVEPPAGVIPAGASVLMVTSYNMCPAANSFAGLSDTLHIIYQNATPSQGHFVNTWPNMPDTTSIPGAPGLRTLMIHVLPSNCGDTVTYDRGQLVNIHGNYAGLSGENDGATVEFSWPGVPQATYVNYGCTAPFIPAEVTMGPPTGDLCINGEVQLAATVPNGFTDMIWQGGTGTFSTPQAANTTYTAGPGEQGEVTLQFCATNACGDQVCGEIILIAGDSPAVTIEVNGDPAICPGGSVELWAVGGNAHVWSTSATGTNIIVDTPGEYSVTSTTACGQAMASVTISALLAPEAMINGVDSFCMGTTIELNAGGGGSYSWSTGETGPTISISEGGTYTVTVANQCGSDEATHEVVRWGVTAAFDLSEYFGEAPLTVTLMNLSVPDDVPFIWDLGDGTTSMETSPVHTYDSPGDYLITLTATVGCSDTAVYLLSVTGPDLPVSTESSLIVPNVFSPNGDGNNDVFEVLGEGIEQLEMSIYNRWGQLIYKIEKPLQSWDGRSFAGENAVEGTYFYELKAAGNDGRMHELRGTLTLLR